MHACLCMCTCVYVCAFGVTVTVSMSSNSGRGTCSKKVKGQRVMSGGSECELPRCGCKGIRSCLVCEAQRSIGREHSTNGEGDARRTLYQCHRCGQIREEGGVKQDPLAPPLFICQASTHDAPSQRAGASRLSSETCCCPDNCVLYGSHDEIGFSGVTVVKEFLSSDEEKDIIASINSHPWAMSQSGRRKQDYGPKVNFKRRKLKQGSFNGLPSYSQPIVDRMRSEITQLAGFIPIELCNLEYDPERGAAIDPHLDDSWVWGERLVSLSLLSHSLFSFTTPSPPPPPPTSHPPPPPTSHPPSSHPPPASLPHTQVLVPLPQRSVVVLSGPARHYWLHAIQRSHIVSTRLSITLRELAPEFLPGGGREEEGALVQDIARRFNGHPTNF